MPRSSTRVFDRPSCELATGALVAILLCAAGAHADDLGASAEDLGAGTGELDAPAENPGAQIFSLSGFGTLGVVHSSEHQADYTNSPYYKPNGAGHSRNWSANVDSRIGLQLDAKFTPQLSAVLQVISEQNYDNSYTPHVEWANIKYAFTPDANVRVGRIVMSTFLASDNIKVGYTYPWVRPPLSVYNMISVFNSDGADASYRFHYGELTHTLQGLYGVSNQKGPNGQNNPDRNSWGIFNTLEYGPATFRLVYQHSTLTLNKDINSFFDQFRQFGSSGIALANKYDVDKKPTDFWGVSASYDPGKWFVMGELGRSEVTPSFIGKQLAWYVSGGYRIGDFTPYIMYSKSKMLSNTSDPGLNLAGVNPFLRGYAAGLNAGLNGFLSPTTGTTVTLGSRWDIKKNVDLKLQFEHLDLDANSSGLLINLQPGFRPGGKVNLISATVDFVF